MKAKLLILIFIVFLCIPVMLPLFRQGFFQSDDGEWMVIRFSAFYQALADGQFPVRFLGTLNHGYGYPVANFLYPGFMYLGVPIHILGFGFVDTIKIIFGASMVGSVIFCYLWLSRFFDKLSSFVGALFYLYTPYHLFDLYKRGSVGEVLALAVLPFILWQIERKSLFWSSTGIALLIISHNTLAILFLPIIIVYPFIRHSGEGSDSRISNLSKRFWTSQNDGIVSVVLGLGISAFFWIPAFYELQYTIFSQTQVSDWSVYFADSSLIGISTFFIFLLTIIFFFMEKIKLAKHRLTALLLIVGMLSIFFASALSEPLWRILPVSFIQFPFRFLSLTIVCVAFLAAVIINTLSFRHSGERGTSDSRISFIQGLERFWTSQNDVKKGLVAILLMFFLTISAFPFLLPKQYFDKGEGIYATNMDTTTVKNEYMPKWVKQEPVERFKEKVEIVEGVGKVENVSYNSKKITFDVFARENMKVRVNTIYYPGWKASVDNQNAAISYKNEKGVMDLSIPSGEHLVKANFTETLLRAISNAISLLSLVMVLFLGIKSLRKSSSV